MKYILRTDYLNAFLARDTEWALKKLVKDTGVDGNLEIFPSGKRRFIPWLPRFMAKINNMRVFAKGRAIEHSADAIAFGDTKEEALINLFNLILFPRDNAVRDSESKPEMEEYLFVVCKNGKQQTFFIRNSPASPVARSKKHHHLRLVK